jgi:hypothetical protein
LGNLLNARMKLEDSASEWPEIYVAMRQYLAERDAIAAFGTGGVPSPLVAGAEERAEVEKLTDEEVNQILLEAAALMTPGAAEDDDMGPPLPPAMRGNDVDADTNAPGGLEELVPGDDDVRGSVLPQRRLRSGVQEADADRNRVSDREAPGRGVRLPAGPADRAGGNSRLSDDRAGGRRAPAGDVRRRATDSTDPSNEENDDVAPPE